MIRGVCEADKDDPGARDVIKPSPDSAGSGPWPRVREVEGDGVQLQDIYGLFSVIAYEG